MSLSIMEFHDILAIMKTETAKRQTKRAASEFKSGKGVN